MALDLRLTCRSERVDTGYQTPCYVWDGKKAGAGYGQLKVGSMADGTRRDEYCHRAAYMEWVGPIPPGKELDHLCNVIACWRPDHLEAVTHAENIKRMHERRAAA